MIRKSFLLLSFFLGASLLGAETVTYVSDPAHSSVSFRIRHFFTPIPGSFAQPEVTIDFDKEDPTQSSVSATIAVRTVNTGNEKRDTHLRSDDYFGVGDHPEMTFESTAWEVAEGENKFRVTGNLSMNGVTKPVELDVELLGIMENKDGVPTSGWKVNTSLDRRDWDITAGQGVVGNNVDVEIFIQAPKA